VPVEFFDGQCLNFHFDTHSFDEVISQADIISLHIPSQENYLINAEVISKMKDGVVIINTSRGGVVCEEDLLNAIEDGKVMGAALDVFEEEPKPSVRLLMNEKLSLTPHLGGSTEEAQERIGLELAEQITAFYKEAKVS